MKDKRQNIRIIDARIGFRNFSGKEGQFNPEGFRNFCVFLDTELAHQLEADQWNVKWLQPRDEGDDPQAYLQVSVRFDRVPPKVVLVSSNGQTMLTEETIGTLDWADLETIDLVITPYEWEMGAKRGVKAYVQIMYAKIVEDEFEKKWANTPDSAAATIGGCGNCEVCDGNCDCGNH